MLPDVCKEDDPGKDGGVPHQSLPYAPTEMDPAGHFIFLLLISSFERWRRRRRGGRNGGVFWDGQRNPRTERVQCQKIKACYLSLPTPPHTHTHMYTFPPCAIFSFLRLVSGSDGVKAARSSLWSKEGERKASLMTGIHPPFLIHLYSYPPWSPVSSLSLSRPLSGHW